MATAFLMAKLNLGVDDALALIRTRRPLVQPNPAFMRRLRALESEIRALPAPVSLDEARLREAFGKYDVDRSGGLNVSELRRALMESGEPANDASRMLNEFDLDGDGELNVDEFVRAWAGRGPIDSSGPT